MYIERDIHTSLSLYISISLPLYVYIYIHIYIYIYSYTHTILLHQLTQYNEVRWLGGGLGEEWRETRRGGQTTQTVEVYLGDLWTSQPEQAFKVLPCEYYLRSELGSPNYL